MITLDLFFWENNNGARMIKNLENSCQFWGERIKNMYFNFTDN